MVLFNVAITVQNYPVLALQYGGTFRMVSAVWVAAFDQPISAISPDSRTASLTAAQNCSGQPKNTHRRRSIQFGLTPPATRTFITHNSGIVLQSGELDIQDDSTATGALALLKKRVVSVFRLIAFPAARFVSIVL